MADDMAALLKQLGYNQVDASATRSAAALAFRLAVQHPEASAGWCWSRRGFSQDGFFPEGCCRMQAAGQRRDGRR